MFFAGVVQCCCTCLWYIIYLVDNEERQLCPVEEMAALRDYRRRRQTYRAKNVHITKKSQTEVSFNVVSEQYCIIIERKCNKILINGGIFMVQCCKMTYK